jgi:hypothetical protein
MGLLDILQGNFAPQPYGGLLYPSPVQQPDEAELAQRARDVAAARLAGGARRSAPITEGPFGPAPAAPAAPEGPAPFAPGAVPFSFAGPGSMNVQPSQMAGPAPAAAPAPAAPAPAPVPAAAPLAAATAAPATDVSASKRAALPGVGETGGEGASSLGASPAAPAAAPAGSPAPASAPFSLGGPGLVDRIANFSQSVQGSKGLIPSLLAGATSIATGERTDPASRSSNSTAQALLDKGASPAEVEAAKSNPTLMQQLISTHFGPKQVQALGEGYVWDSRQGKAVKVFEPSTGKAVLQDVASRKAAAEAMGLKPTDPAYQGFVLAGKWPKENEQPLTAGDKKVIGDADEKILSVRQVIDNLNQAKTLSKKSYDGMGAGFRGWLGSNVGLEGGTNTADLDNLVTTNSLGQLKAIFGGNPTEGERKILLEVQGSVNQPDAVRQRIWDRAIQMAQQKLSLFEQRANELRGGNYYKPGHGAPAPAAAPLSSGKTSSGIPWSVQ